MLSRSTLRLVLLVSLAHGLVHVFEHSLACVEQLVAEDAAFAIDSDPVKAKQVTGTLGSTLRLPFGFCALLAGWLADRYGSKRLLLIYLVGGSFAALLAWWTPTLAVMYAAMFTLGMFASIYHPAGVSLIARHTTPENRSLALGYHGVFGSMGIAAGPFLAGAVLATGATWRQYYLVLTVPGILLALLLRAMLSHEQGNFQDQADGNNEPHPEDDAHWGAYATLMATASLTGTVYAGMLTFLPRYLDTAGVSFGDVSDESMRNFLTGAVLAVGAIGQYTAGRLARPVNLEILMAGSFFAAVPFLFWMGFAEGVTRLWVAGCFVLLFFTHQPIFNSLIAKYVPRRRHSVCFGLSFTIGFGVGAIGPTISGFAKTDLANFTILSALLTVVATLCLSLWWRHGRK